MRLSSAIYTTAAKVLGRIFLGTPIVRTIYIRRSVAAEEAVFPLSDLDLSIIVNPCSAVAIDALRSRYALARLAFPRLGECHVYTADDFADFAEVDPYRASLDRRYAVTVYGDPPAIPIQAIPVTETGRRLVFWFEHYIQRARTQGNRRNLHKFALEIANALGVLEQRWHEPLTSRRETATRFALPSDDPFEACLILTARAHSLLRPGLQTGTGSFTLPGLVVTTSALETPARKGVKVMSPEVFDLLLHLQDPGLWDVEVEQLQQAGFRSPTTRARLLAARRWASGDKLRGPGFHTMDTSQVVARLENAARILEVNFPSELSTPPRHARAYYLQHYDRMCTFATNLRELANAKLTALPPE